jgi:hypothetical protein
VLISKEKLEIGSMIILCFVVYRPCKPNMVFEYSNSNTIFSFIYLPLTVIFSFRFYFRFALYVGLPLAGYRLARTSIAVSTHFFDCLLSILYKGYIFFNPPKLSKNPLKFTNLPLTFKYIIQTLQL